MSHIIAQKIVQSTGLRLVRQAPSNRGNGCLREIFDKLFNDMALRKILQ